MNTSGLLNRRMIFFVIENEHVPLPPAKDILIGRFAPTDSIQPDVDLGPFKADEKGVSRRHAKVIYENGRYWIIDLSSMNGTWLNGTALQPVARYPLQNGDRLRLGKLDLIVKFGTSTFTSSPGVP